MTDYRLTPQASRGLRVVLADVEDRFGTGLARRVLERLVRTFELLAEQPGLGHARPDLTSDSRVRFWAVGPNLIAYRSMQESLENLIVERGARDWTRLLRPPYDDNPGSYP